MQESLRGRAQVGGGNSKVAGGLDLESSRRLSQRSLVTHPQEQVWTVPQV